MVVRGLKGLGQTRTSRSANGGTADTTGLEIEVTGYLTDRLKISASVSTGSAEYTEDIVFDGEVDTPKGTPMPFAPDLRYWVGIDYTIPDLLAGGDVWMRWDISGQSDSYNNRFWVDDDGSTVEADILPAWDVSNATIGWQSESWQVNVRVNNVFDKKYFQSFSSGNNYIAEDWYPGETRFQNFRTYNRPREIRLQIRKDF
jgi:outer membrane receptor protein involved in Fe transport